MRATVSGLHSGQLAIVRATMAADAYGRELYDRLVAVTSRQWGKSTVGVPIVAHWLTKYPQEAAVCWALHKWKLCKEIFRQKLLPFLDRLGLLAYKSFSDCAVETPTGARVFFSTAGADAGIRGFTLTHLVGDEFDYWPPDFYHTVVAPALLVHGRQELIMSTPRGKNQLYAAFQEGVPGSAQYNPRVWAFRGTYDQTNNPTLKRRAEMRRASMAPADFAAEYEAQFTDGGSVFQTLDEIRTSKFGMPGRRTIVGVDVGFKNDRTVVVCLNEDCEMIGFKRLTHAEQSSIQRQADVIGKYLSGFPGVMGYVEENFNRALWEMLTMQGLKGLTTFYTTAQNKQEIIGRLITAVHGGILKVPDMLETRVVYEELGAFESSYSEIKRLTTFGARPGRHDDCVMALAFAVHAYFKTYPKRFYQLQQAA